MVAIDEGRCVILRDLRNWSKGIGQGTRAPDMVNVAMGQDDVTQGELAQSTQYPLRNDVGLETCSGIEKEGPLRCDEVKVDIEGGIDYPLDFHS